MVRRVMPVAAVLLLAVMVGIPAGAANTSAETTAVAYVTAFQNGRWEDAKLLASDAALSFVELVQVRKGTTDGFTKVEAVESEVIGDSVRVKVYYANKDGKIVPRYVKVKSVGVGKDAVVDDKLVGSDWVSSSYSKGLFKKPETIGGITLQVLGYLQMGDEIKFDLYFTNGGKLDRYIMPMQEAFCVVEIGGTFKKRYYSLVPETVTDGLLKAGTSVRTFALMPFWQKDPATAGLKGEKLSWILYIPFGPIDQFAIEYL